MAGGNGIVERATELSVPSENEFVTAMGITLRLRPVPAGKIHGAIGSVPIPHPPELPKKPGASPDDPDYDVVYVNEADPKYQEAVREYNRITQEITQNITLYEGTEVIAVPEGMFRPEEDGWIAIAEDDELTLGYARKVRREGKLRYIDYLMLYALANADYLELLNYVARMAGRVLETDVEDAQDSFRGTPERASNSARRSSPQERGRR
jgi:hypothetical protein